MSLQPRTRVCPICDGEFEQTVSRQKYCSRSCAGAANLRRAQLRAMRLSVLNLASADDEELDRITRGGRKGTS